MREGGREGGTTQILSQAPRGGEEAGMRGHHCNGVKTEEKIS